MSDELVVAQCSPTMAGLKTGSLFTCPLENKKALTNSIRRLNTKLVPCGIRLLPVKYMENRVLIYMYRPERLKRDLEDETAKKILSSKDYPTYDMDRCVTELIRRLNNDAAFPHEVGLFLGYPPEDVDGFIKNGAHQAKCVGVWKVYGDEEAAKHKFAQYEKCTRLYCEAFRKHNSFDRLLVSCS